MQDETLGKPECLSGGTAIDKASFAAGEAGEGFDIGAVDEFTPIIESREHLGEA
jgi:hypothetical protein